MCTSEWPTSILLYLHTDKCSIHLDSTKVLTMPSLLRLCVTLALAMGSCAQQYIDDMSFGHKQGISPNSFAIPGWSMLGEGHVPQLLSDKVILTPPYGANKKGGLWTENTNNLKDWQVDFEFRVASTDRGIGNLQLWYVSNGAHAVSANSIYTVNKFDGLALVIDTVGGTQKIRGFLNDGNVDFRTHNNVDSLAFGHCDYAYRNIGQPSRLRLKSTTSGIDVTIDDKPCFTTSKAVLPANNYFGLTASSSDPPDSFEIFKFAVSQATAPAAAAPPPPVYQQQQARQVRPDNIPASDSPPSAISQAQFDDLNNRLNKLSTSITNLFDLVTKQSTTLDSIITKIPQINPSTLQSLSTLDSRISNLDRLVSSLADDLKSSDHKTQFAKLSEQIQRNHETVSEHVPQRLREYVIAHTPRIGFILYSFMAFQTCCVGAWVWFKWRKSTMPKKYL